jgi:apolipoprotein D and lipocalin family protein
MFSFRFIAKQNISLSLCSPKSSLIDVKLFMRYESRPGGFMKLFSAVFLMCLMAVAARSEIPTAHYVDLNRYIGKWYEVASIPQSFQKKCVANTTAEYSFAEDDLIKVLNSCDTKKGDRDVAEGRAKVVDTATNSKLKVTFVKLVKWIFTFGGNYWILDVPADYSYAMIGDPTLEYAWILSRTPNLEKTKFIEIESKFKALGYDTCKILTSVQTGGIATRIPLCEYVK